jgi:hypothetical protein
MNRSRIALCAAVLVLGSVLVPAAEHYAAAADRPWMNKALPPAQRAKMLVAAMTLDEKVQQIHMVDVPDHPREVTADGLGP